MPDRQLLYDWIMKRKITALLLFSSLLIFSCKKTAVEPDTDGITISTPTTSTSTTGQTTTGSNVDGPSVTGLVRLKLSKDSINTDAILINFKPTAKPIYVIGEDAPALQGYGVVILSSISSDNIPLAINSLPLSGKGRSINLSVSSTAEGIYKLDLESMTSVPAGYEVWLTDNYKKDSLDMRLNSSYSFNIYKADTASSGRNRFKLKFHYKVN
jgi:hypothetical protein